MMLPDKATLLAYLGAAKIIPMILFFKFLYYVYPTGLR